VLRRFAEYHDLEGAFGRRALTERAKGILMERHAIDEESAFAMLREQSRAANQQADRSRRRQSSTATGCSRGHRRFPLSPDAQSVLVHHGRSARAMPPVRGERRWPSHVRSEVAAAILRRGPAATVRAGRHPPDSAGAGFRHDRTPASWGSGRRRAGSTRPCSKKLPSRLQRPASGAVESLSWHSDRGSSATTVVILTREGTESTTESPPMTSPNRISSVSGDVRQDHLS
jgi:hypothetical protein